MNCVYIVRCGQDAFAFVSVESAKQLCPSLSFAIKLENLVCCVATADLKYSVLRKHTGTTGFQ